MMLTVMHTALPMTLHRSRLFRIAQLTIGVLVQIWCKEDRILTLPSCIQVQAGMPLAMR
jgi:hypothetical protein